MSDIPTNTDNMTPQELLESPRGSFLIAKAFHYAEQQISRFPEARQSSNDCEDMLKILNGCFPGLAEQFRENDRKWSAVFKPHAVNLESRRPEEDAPDS